jgi:fluoride exporter
MTVLMVILGAALGAPARYVTDWVIQGRHGSVFPWGTFTVNVSGSAMLGFLVALAAPGAAGTVAGIAFCGAFTTYSMFSFETVRLAGERAYLLAALNVVVSIGAALGAAYAGLAVAQAIT